MLRPASLELQAKGTHLTRTRLQMDPLGLIDQSEVAPFIERADIGPVMTSMRPMEGGGVSCISIYRAFGQPPFTERDAKTAHIILSEVPWLHFHAYPDQPCREISKLYPRHRTVLNCLCEGWSRQTIAGHLGLSVNTIHGYAKAVFKHFGVHTQAELLSRFTIGDGGDI